MRYKDCTSFTPPPQHLLHTISTLDQRMAHKTRKHDNWCGEAYHQMLVFRNQNKACGRAPSHFGVHIHSSSPPCIAPVVVAYNKCICHGVICIRDAAPPLLDANYAHPPPPCKALRRNIKSARGCELHPSLIVPPLPFDLGAPTVCWQYPAAWYAPPCLQRCTGRAPSTPPPGPKVSGACCTLAQNSIWHVIILPGLSI
jgi:hypothetical protein